MTFSVNVFSRNVEGIIRSYPCSRYASNLFYTQFICGWFLCIIWMLDKVCGSSGVEGNCVTLGNEVVANCRKSPPDEPRPLLGSTFHRKPKIIVFPPQLPLSRHFWFTIWLLLYSKPRNHFSRIQKVIFTVNHTICIHRRCTQKRNKMSFLGGAECSTAGNPLSQFTKHVQDDKSLQRDRLVGRGPGSAQGMRSTGMNGSQDNVSLSQSVSYV